jgi:hypothetical protein
MNLFKHARNIIQKKWQQRSIIHYLEVFLDSRNVFTIKKRGFELLLLFLDIMQDEVDNKVIDLLMNTLKFEPFVEGTVKLPTYDIRGTVLAFSFLVVFVRCIHTQFFRYLGGGKIENSTSK